MTALPYILALFSIGLGAIGWLAPRYTMEVLGMAVANGNMAMSEIRAASGALFIGLGMGVIWLQSPIAVRMLGFAWAGAAIGRATSLMIDGASPKKWIFFAVEISVALIAIWLAPQMFKRL